MSSSRMQSARELTAVIWGQEVANALRQIDDILDDTARDQPTLRVFGEGLKRVLRSLWDDPHSDVFELE